MLLKPSLSGFGTFQAEAEAELKEARKVLESVPQKVAAAAAAAQENAARGGSVADGGDQPSGAAQKKRLRKGFSAAASTQLEDDDTDSLNKLDRRGSAKRRKSHAILEDSDDEGEETLRTEEPSATEEDVEQEHAEGSSEEASYKTARASVESGKSVEEELEELDEVACKQCSRDDHGEEMLLCDGCDHGYHMYCLDPPLKKVPKDDWFCPACTKPKKARASPAAEEAGPSSGQQVKSSGKMELDESDVDIIALAQPPNRGRRMLADSSDDDNDFADAAVTVQAAAVQVKAEPGRCDEPSCLQAKR